MQTTVEQPVIDFTIDEHRLFSKVFYKIRSAKSRFVVVYGGAGSSKSYSVHQNELLHIMESGKGDTLFFRKHATGHRESCYKLLNLIIKSWGLTDLFHSVYGNDNRRITYLPNGRSIVLKGLDDSEKIKSITDFKRVVIEEASEISFDDFKEVVRRARGHEDTQFTLLLNPVDENHWIKKNMVDADGPYYKDTTALRFTYRDNVNSKGQCFLTEKDIAEIERFSLVDMNQYRIYALGEWGRPSPRRPYAQNFSKERHVSELAVHRPNLPVIFSLDFNVEPFVCVCAHVWTDAAGQHIHVFDEVVIENNGSVPEMCDRLANLFGMRTMAMALFTGDATSNKRDINARDNMSAWRLIDARFRLGNRLKVPRSNPPVKENRHLVSAILGFHPDIKISPKCKKLLYDLQFVECDEEGNLLKQNRDNLTQRSDALDCFRYLLNSFCADFYKRYGNKF